MRLSVFSLVCLAAVCYVSRVLVHQHHQPGAIMRAVHMLPCNMPACLSQQTTCQEQEEQAVHGCLLQGFYADFARVADDESRHLSWCLQRLEELGYAYGDMVAHSILWEGAQASSGKARHRELETGGGNHYVIFITTSSMITSTLRLHAHVQR